jgi:hypothetical protein
MSGNVRICTRPKRIRISGFFKGPGGIYRIPQQQSAPLYRADRVPRYTGHHAQNSSCVAPTDSRRSRIRAQISGGRGVPVYRWARGLYRLTRHPPALLFLVDALEIAVNKLLGAGFPTRPAIRDGRYGPQRRVIAGELCQFECLLQLLVGLPGETIKSVPVAGVR